MNSPDLQLADLRERARRGERLTKEEVRQAITLMRQNRSAAVKSGKKSSSAPVRSASELIQLFNNPIVG